MTQLFVSALGRLRERWIVAFPDARVVSDIAEAREQQSLGISSLWLDLSSIPGNAQLVTVESASSMGCPVVAMMGVPEEAQAFSLLKAGAQGYCHVKAAPEQLREVATVVEHGGLWMPANLVQRFLAVSTRLIPAAVPEIPELNELTSRELTVAEHVARGASNREIAQALEITERTVKAHISAIFEKLGVRDRVQLALRVNNLPTYSSTLN
jgi:DNA-binding NarL/FixJ family response regulator